MHKYQKINYYIDIFCIFSSDSKNTNEKKLKKLYLDKCSSGLLLPKSILNARSIKIFFVFIYFLSIGFSTQMSAQESIITGLENIHISEGAIIIVQSKKDTLELKNNENNLLTSHNKTSKNIQSKKDKKSISFAKKNKKINRGKND